MNREDSSLKDVVGIGNAPPYPPYTDVPWRPDCSRSNYFMVDVILGRLEWRQQRGVVL